MTVELQRALKSKNYLEKKKNFGQLIQPNFQNDYTASVIKQCGAWLLQMSTARVRTKVTRKLPSDSMRGAK